VKYPISLDHCRRASRLAELFFTVHGGTSVENSATLVHNVPPNRHRQWEIQIVQDCQSPSNGGTTIEGLFIGANSMQATNQSCKG
jgi:hypothetical protein